MARLRRYRSDLLALLTLFVLPLIWFAPVLFPSLISLTLLPFDNLFGFEPWHSLNPGLVPHNDLLSDLILENVVWKQHIRQTIADGQLPLWNPQVFTGLPFLAAGQASTFYPLSLIFYLFPLEAAYGWFTALQIGLAGANVYLLGRVLRLKPVAALFSGAVFAFSGFMIVSVVFTMFIAAAAWLPLLLAIIEFVVQKQEEKGAGSFRPIPYVVVGALVVGVMILAGHPELIYYTMLVAALYSLTRLVMAWRRIRLDSVQGDEPAAGTQITARVLGLAGWLLLMAVLGIAVGGLQLLPLVELLPYNFREGSASYEQVVGWAWPIRHILSFAIPDIFGNPSHHGWFDLWSGRWIPATVNALGEYRDTIFWGVKNYVEGGAYLGLATWLLATIALLAALLARPRTYRPDAPFYSLRLTPFFAVLAVVSLLFAFGTPLYALLFYGLPGWSQLHGAFRWVFPFTLCMAVLGGTGLQSLLEIGKTGDWRLGRLRFATVVKTLALATMLVGLGALLLVGVSFWLPATFFAFGQRVVDGSDLAQMAFADGRMFWGYQALNLAKFGVFALLSGSLVWWMTRRPNSADDATPSPSRPLQIAGLLVVLLLVLDLWAIHGRFNPTADVSLSPLEAENKPVPVAFLDKYAAINGDGQPWRFTTFNRPGEKTFNANVGMYFGWQDVRGYDSIIPRQYVDFMERIAPQENELLYNRIAPLYANATGETYALLDNPLLDLLNVRYLLSEHFVPNPTWHEIYRDEALGIYENQEVMPRAFVAREARVVPAEVQRLVEADLRDVVFIEEPPADEQALVAASPQPADARISRYTANDVFVDVNLSDRGWLVLADAWFPGWKAFVRPFGGDENQEQELAIHRANSAFRAVYLPSDGQWTVRFVYSPMSFKLGLFTSFLALMILLLLLLWWAWGKYYRPEVSEGEVRTVAKNSIVPMTLSLANKAIDFAFAMLYVRLLGPVGTGQYYFVVALYGFFEILSRYGLGTLLTRDVAADKNQSSRYLTNVIALRTLLWALTMPVLALVTFFYWSLGQFGGLGLSGIGRTEVMTIALLAPAMLFANWADGLSSMFSAFEKMEYPAGLTNAVAVLKVTFGALVLLLGWGIVGLAGVSLLINILQVLWLYSLLRRTLFVPEWQWDWPLQRWMFRTSGPLMINHLLASIFWRIDVWILRPLAGAASVGLYSVGLKYLDGLNIIPSIFTMALFPLMSRYAQREGEGLLRSYVISLRLLIIVSLPIAVAVTFLAEPLVWLVGGAQYLNVPETITLFGQTITFLGGSDVALQVIIWSIPIGFANSVTQFVLIAVNQQRYLTKAFVIGVVFNTAGNLLLIPSLGYLGAAFVTILSEFSLLFPFYYSVKRNVGVVPWPSIFVAPAASAAAMAATIYALEQIGLHAIGGVMVGAVVYLAALFLTGAFRHEGMDVVAKALPAGPLRRFVVRGAGP